MSWLDKLPAAVRHFLILVVVAPLAGALALILSAIVTAGGLGVDWSTVLGVAGDSAAVTAASGALAWLGLVVTPITRQYGVGTTPDPVGDHEAAPGEGVDAGDTPPVA